MPAKIPVVLDISHHNTVKSFAEVRMSGIQGIIHKASQGATMGDKTYAKRRKDAAAVGLLWGCYHFADSSTVKTQVSNFLRNADPDENTLLCLDWEPNGKRTMSVDQAKEFLQLVYEKTGQRPVLYSGNLIKEQVKKPDDFLCLHRLWIAQYGPKVILPKGWDTYWLWQFTEKFNEAQGVTGLVDANYFGGSDLAAEWTGIKPKITVAVDNTKVKAPIEIPKSPEKVTPKDLVPVSRKANALNWLKRKWQVILGLFSIDQIMQALGVAQDTRTKVEGFVSDHAAVIYITIAITSLMAVIYIMNLMADDANEGRYTPSKSEPSA